MKYEQVWDAVDKLARAHGLSPSGLAKKPALTQQPLTKANEFAPTAKKMAFAGQHQQNSGCLQRYF